MSKENKQKQVAQHETEAIRDRVAHLELQLKQALADYQNLKRDMDKRLQFEGDLVRADVLRTLIGIADDVDIALSHKDGGDENGWREGIVMILQKMQSVVEQSGARKIECDVGDMFDPRLHEAVGVLYEGKDGTIAKIVQNGYTLGDVMVKPVRVIVNKHKINNTKNGQNTGN
jgi:molecular chaperone GrpE